ncbi:hypothetical protein JOF42_002441 [Microbacterium phyllosphaerae]|uniref:Uncharacterized protein n=1 Tax=Microbacterium phyllosphaerae TaxID=124798 RepID=A0ABS4WS13_9MICO|nr:hypothetical protein [Microbacterium phyllosphaerae]MBP2378946.1 hypothetical protein [Microbacterium phyllosphaerae]
MTTTNTATDIETATRAAGEADERVDAIRASIRTGNTKIKPGDLESAEADARLAHLRIESIEAAALTQTELDRLEAISAVRAEIEAAIDDPTPFVEALRAVEKASIAWIELNEARAAEMRGWRKRLRDLGVNEVRRGTTAPEASGIAPLLSNYAGLDILIDTGHIGSVDASEYLTALTTLPTAAILHPERRPEDLYARLVRELGHVPNKN